MADEPLKPAPGPQPGQAAPVDQGLVSWANLVRERLAMESGVEVTGSAGSSVNFRFRGQTFSVIVVRIT
jgi:hypothetical protein